jgi:hypothetical protein
MWFRILNSYQALLGMNMVIRNVKEGETNSVILQAKAENLFLRAFVNFNLVRVYGRPYYQGPESNPGVPLVLEPITSTNNAPARATVKDSYAQIIKDLTDAIPLFSQKKANSYAAKYAAFALLSRVYLYMSGTFANPDLNYAKLAEQAADSGQSLFDAILQERRLELAFEGHIGYDYFRVGLPMVRSYPSFNSNPITIAATDPRVVMRISQDVMIENNKLTQNDQ